MLNEGLQVDDNVGMGCSRGYFFGSTRLIALKLLFFSLLAMSFIVAIDLWQMIDPIFIEWDKEQAEEEENEEYRYSESTYYLYQVISIGVACSMPLCVYFGASKMNKGLLHLFAGHSIVCAFFTFIVAFQYLFFKHELPEAYTFGLGALEFFAFLAFISACSLSLNLLRQAQEYSANATYVSEPQQETFGSVYPMWVQPTHQPEPVVATYATNTNSNTVDTNNAQTTNATVYPNYPVATVVGIVPENTNQVHSTTSQGVELQTVDFNNSNHENAIPSTSVNMHGNNPFNVVTEAQAANATNHNSNNTPSNSNNSDDNNVNSNCTYVQKV